MRGSLLVRSVEGSAGSSPIGEVEDEAMNDEINGGERPSPRRDGWLPGRPDRRGVGPIGRYIADVSLDRRSLGTMKLGDIVAEFGVDGVDGRLPGLGDGETVRRPGVADPHDELRPEDIATRDFSSTETGRSN